jgi:hypothetical protein
MAKIKKVYINTCSRRAPEWGMILKLQMAMQHASKHKITARFAPRVGESLICRARNNSLIDFMESDCDFLFTIDDDIELPLNAIVKLVKNDKDICAGFYRLKRNDKAHTAVRISKEVKAEIPIFSDVFKKGLVIPAQYVSTGCMLVKRSVVDGMVKHYPKLHYTQNITFKPACALYQPYIYDDEYLSEDWAFCQRARDAGFEIWADGSIRCAHWGLIKYDFGEEGN